MTASENSAVEYATAAHGMLLRLAGQLPDESVAQARQWLADGETGRLAEAVASAALAAEIPVTEAEAWLLQEFLGASGPDLSTLAQIGGYAANQAARYHFEPDGPGSTDQQPEDEIDRAVIDAVAAESSVRGLWRSRRHAFDEVPPVEVCRVYLAEVDVDGDPIGVTGRLQRSLERAGETDPRVEVYEVGAELPVYQRMARAGGALLWARTPAPDIKIAVLFDEVDPELGPSFHADHPQLADDAERRRLLDYLGSGQPLLLTTARMEDVVERARGLVVPVNFRTDGTWIWTDSSTYYLDQYGFVPDQELVAHIRSLDYEFPEVDGVAVHRTLHVLQQPPEEEPVWTYGGSARS